MYSPLPEQEIPIEPLAYVALVVAVSLSLPGYSFPTPPVDVAEAPTPRAGQHRWGDVWESLRDLPEGKALPVGFDNIREAKLLQSCLASTRTSIRASPEMKALSKRFATRIVGTTLWLIPRPAEKGQ